MKAMVNPDLPGMIKGLRLAAKRRIDPHSSRGRHLIQASLHLLQTLGYGPIQSYDFDQYFVSTKSSKLGRELDLVDGDLLRSAEPDLSIGTYDILVEALTRGDGFVLTLSCAVSIREINPAMDTKDLIEFHARQIPSQLQWIDEAWSYLEERAWPITCR